MDSLAKRDELVRPPLSIEEYVRRLYEENEDSPASEDELPPSPGPGSGRPLRPNEELVSRTDPEATLVDRPEFGRHLAYKAHLAVSGRRGQVITAAVATTGAAADEHHLAEVLWQHHRLSGLGIPEAVADAKYGTTFNFLYLGRLGIPAFIPLTRWSHDVDRTMGLPRKPGHSIAARTCESSIRSLRHVTSSGDSERYRCGD